MFWFAVIYFRFRCPCEHNSIFNRTNKLTFPKKKKMKKLFVWSHF